MMDATANLKFLAKLDPDDLFALKNFIQQQMEESIRSKALFQRLAVESVRSEMANERLEAITAKTGAAPEDAMVLALTLYDIVVDASEQGLRLILVDKNYGFVREVTGLIPKPSELQREEKVAG